MTRPLLSALAVSPLLLALAPAPADLSFHPADGSTVTRAYSIEMDFELGDLSVVVDGQDMSEMIPAEFEGSAEMLMKVTENFVRTAGGRPLELIRSFEEMSGEASAMGESEAIEDFDSLEGKSVRFLWDEDEGDYTVEFHDSDGDEADLEGLSADMDARKLLPGKEVAEGDVWTVDARELESVLLFGARMETGDEEFEQLFESEIWPQVEGLLDDFTTTCEYKGEREEGDRKVGVIGVTMHGEGLIDLAEMLLSAVNLDAGEMDVDIDIEVAELSVAFDAEGELMWDVEGGHLHAYGLEAEMEFNLQVAVSADVGGESHSADADGELLGSATWKVVPAGE